MSNTTQTSGPSANDATAETAQQAPAAKLPGVHYPGPRGFRITEHARRDLLALFGLLLVAALTGNLPDTMIAGFAVTILFGGLLIWIGNLSRWCGTSACPPSCAPSSPPRCCSLA